VLAVRHNQWTVRRLWRSPEAGGQSA